MASLNKAMIIGNLGVKPELRYTQSDNAVTTLRIATNERWTDREGVQQERTEWHNVVVFGRTAENCVKYLDKGRSVYVEGRLQTREWEDKEGNRRWTTEIVANQVTFLSGGDAPSGGYDSSFDQSPRGGRNFDQSSGGDRSGGGGSSYDQSFDDDDIPF